MSAKLMTLILSVKWLTSITLCAAALWAIIVAPDWESSSDRQSLVQILILVTLVFALLEKEAWQALSRRIRLSRTVLQAATLLILIVMVALVTPYQMMGYGLVVTVYITYTLLLLIISLILKDRTRTALMNLAVSLASFAFTLMLIDLLAPSLTNAIASFQRQLAINTARAAANAPIDANLIAGEVSNHLPNSSSPQSEVIQPGGGPTWGLQTGWGTNTNTILRYWMEGVYDNEIVYNSLGFRGPEITYEKPADVYRIMLIGDSFIEAREVRYEDTVYAQLADLLADVHTPNGKRFEVFGIGATGWGTLQAYLYYHHEGYRFEPDLIIHFFIINDVADNHPQHFYQDRNIDFIVDQDHIQLIVDGKAPEEQSISTGQRLLDALPPVFAHTNTAALIRRVIAPPRESVTLAGSLSQAHPQNYIFVRHPEIDGYPEGWRRTTHAYQIWAREANANNSKLMVVAVDISVERITEISTYYPDEQDNWVWDVDLPYTRLAEILNPIGVNLILTRDHYAQHALSAGKRPFDALFFPQDGHWNPEGHRATAQLAADTLRKYGILAD
jgi:hypothetical protein